MKCNEKLDWVSVLRQVTNYMLIYRSNKLLTKEPTKTFYLMLEKSRTREKETVIVRFADNNGSHGISARNYLNSN